MGVSLLAILYLRSRGNKISTAFYAVLIVSNYEFKLLLFLNLLQVQ